MIFLFEKVGGCSTARGLTIQNTTRGAKKIGMERIECWNY